MSQANYKRMTESEKIKEDWMNAKWRPAMGWIYMVTCTCDFILFPIFWTSLQSITGADVTQWNPITLQGAGLYHLAMGAVLGVAAWSRGQEKLAGVAGATPTQNTTQPSREQQVNRASPRQITAKSVRVLPDDDNSIDPDYKPRVDPEARG